MAKQRVVSLHVDADPEEAEHAGVDRGRLRTEEVRLAAQELRSGIEIGLAHGDDFGFVVTTDAARVELLAQRRNEHAWKDGPHERRKGDGKRPQALGAAATDEELVLEGLVVV